MTDFVLAAAIAGSGDAKIIYRHMLPSFLSHVIATLTLAIPHMILAETALSFIGLGMQAPAISWGVLLKAAQNLETLAKAPWIPDAGARCGVVYPVVQFRGRRGARRG